MFQLRSLLRLFHLSILSSMFSVLIGYGQVMKEDVLKKDLVLSADTIVYFGLDLSKLQLVDPKKVGTEAVVNKYFGPWINYIDETSIRFQGLSTLLDKKVIEKKEYVQKLFKKRLNEDWISFTRSPLTLDSIQNLVNGYQLPEVKRPIGLVIVLETFDKLQERVILNFTFFEIQTKNIIWRTKLEGAASGAGMTKHWGKGAENAIFHFGSFFKKELRAYQKKK